MASRVDAVMPAVTVRNGDRNDDGKEGDDELQASLVPAMLAANKEDDGELRREVNALECAVVEAEDRISLLLSQMLALERELQEPWHPASCLCLTVEGGTATAGSVAVETGTGTGSGRTCVHVGGMRLAALPDPSINLSWDEIGGGWSALAVHLTLLSNALSIPIPLPDAATATSAAPVHVTQTHQHQHQHQQHRPASAQYPVEMPRSFAVRALRRYAVAVQYSPTFEAVRMDGRVSLKVPLSHPNPNRTRTLTRTRTQP